MKFIPLLENIVLHNPLRSMNLCKQFKKASVEKSVANSRYMA